MDHPIRPLIPSDAAYLDDFLRPHTAEAYWLRSNALAGGLAYEGKYLQAEYFGAFRDNRLVGAVAYSWMNTILLFADEPACLRDLAASLLPCIRKRDGVVDAILGLAEQADAVIKALKIPVTAWRCDDSDGLFRLKLDQLRMPSAQSGFFVRKAEEKDREQIVAWRIAFNIEAVNAAPGAELERKVREEISARLPLGELFVLEHDGNLLSYCGVGGHVPDTVMVGPVWVPVDFRCRGYGRAVTAEALKILADERPALRHAALFASKPDAIRLYEAIGFKRIADWRLALLKEDYRVESVA